MIVVTGGAGFIGSNIVKYLNDQGHNNILVVDHLKNGTKFANLVDLDIADYLDRDVFIDRVRNGELPKIEAIFHEGACSSTTEWDGQYMMNNNYEYSKALLAYALNMKIPFLYASSAATYGGRSDHFIESRAFEKPLNVYGYSKFLFDQYVRNIFPTASSPICGFRYFNVYGPRESHKGKMASVAYHLNQQIHNNEPIQLFEGSEGFKRDFIYVEDVAKMNYWFWQNDKSGIYNCGTGHAESFQVIADTVLDFHKRGILEYVPFPEELKGRYQTFTEANLDQVRAAGYDASFTNVREGVMRYMEWLNQ